VTKTPWKFSRRILHHGLTVSQELTTTLLRGGYRPCESCDFTNKIVLSNSLKIGKYNKGIGKINSKIGKIRTFT